ncbi:hypothetical protein M8818_002884 [Zalaria obscura]|uniref:Uncharacterized protein n=1 Tax=Zalaria obscura TaxID=2024903 RepID=A0ACC3SLL1_9PEZI
MGRPDSPTKKHRFPFHSNKWRQNDKGWFMETISIVASPRTRITNSVATQAQSEHEPDPEGDRLMPMPSAQDPQPYKSAQIKAFEHYRLKAKQLSVPSQAVHANPEVVNEQTAVTRMHSVGAGPRKFAQASRALRECSGNNSPVEQAKDDQKLTVLQCPKPEAPLQVPIGAVLNDPFQSPPGLNANFAPFKSPRTPANRDTNNMMTAMHTMPGGFEVSTTTSTTSTTTITRKPVGSTSRTGRRPSDASLAATATSAEEKEVCASSPSSSPDSSPDPNLPPSRPRSDSFSRGQDVRQLPRMRLAHPGTAGTVPFEDVYVPAPGPDFKGRRVFTLPDDADSPPARLPYPRHSLYQMPQSHGSMALEQQQQQQQQQRPRRHSMSLGPEAHILTTLALLLSVPIRWTKALVCHSSRFGVVAALDVVNRPTASPQEKVDAIKALVVAAARAGVLLMAVMVVWRVGAAVRELVEIVLFPLNVVVAVLKWVMGVS